MVRPALSLYLHVVPLIFNLCRCGHCKRLAPEYEKAATALAGDDPAIPLAKVDCPANSGLCSRFGVTGYPTLKIFRGGEFSADYGGPRSAGKGWRGGGVNVGGIVSVFVLSRWYCPVHEETGRAECQR